MGQCKDIEIENHSHCRQCREMFPCGANKITALDQEIDRNPDLSAAPLTVKIDFREGNLDTLRKLQVRISSSATGNSTPQVSSSAAACRDGSGANLYYIKSLYYRSAASTILHTANPSSTFISSNATCTAPTPGFVNCWKNSAKGDNLPIERPSQNDSVFCWF